MICEKCGEILGSDITECPNCGWHNPKPSIPKKPATQSASEPTEPTGSYTGSSKKTAIIIISVILALFCIIAIVILVATKSGSKASNPNMQNHSMFGSSENDNIIIEPVVTTVKNDVKDQAQTIRVNEPIGDALESSHDTNWYCFALDENGYINISFGHMYYASPETYWEMYLYKEDGQTPFDDEHKYWSVSGEGSLLTCDIALPKGTYYIKIVPYSTSRWTDNLYTLEVCYSQSNVWEREANNNKYNANNIATNTVYYGSITNDSDADWYKIVIDHDGYLNILFDHEELESSETYWEFYLYRDDGETYYDGGSKFWSVVGDSKLSTCNIGLSAGTYYLKVVPYSSSRWSSETYNFIINYEASDTWEAELNNSKYQANSIELDTQYSGSITNSNDQDWYAIELTEPGYIKIKIEHEVVESSECYWELYVYGLDGKTTFDGTNGYWGIAGEKGLLTSDIGLAAGKYYIKIIPYSSSRWSSKTYNITVNHYVSYYWESEMNNNKYEADEMSMLSNYSGSISSSTDSDWYVFSLNYPRDIAISFDHRSLDSSLVYWELYLYKSDGSTNASNKYWNFYGNSAGITDEVSLDAGTYYIKIVPYSSSRWSNATYSIGLQ